MPHSYKAATKVSVKHETLRPGDPCPECPTGKVYRQETVGLGAGHGHAPLGAKVVELERLPSLQLPSAQKGRRSMDKKVR